MSSIPSSDVTLQQTFQFILSRWKWLACGSLAGFALGVMIWVIKPGTSELKTIYRIGYLPYDYGGSSSNLCVLDDELTNTLEAITKEFGDNAVSQASLASDQGRYILVVKTHSHERTLAAQAFFETRLRSASESRYERGLANIESDVADAQMLFTEIQGELSALKGGGKKLPDSIVRYMFTAQEREAKTQLKHLARIQEKTRMSGPLTTVLQQEKQQKPSVLFILVGTAAGLFFSLLILLIKQSVW